VGTEVLETIGTVLAAVVTAGGASFATLASYQTWRQKRQPVISGIDEWREVVSAQKLWLKDIETYIRILIDQTPEDAIVALWRYLYDQNAGSQIRGLEAMAQDKDRQATERSEGLLAEARKALESSESASDATQKSTWASVSKKQMSLAKSIEAETKQEAGRLREEKKKIEAEREQSKALVLTSSSLPGPLPRMFSNSSAPVLLQLRQGRQAITACRESETAVTLVHELASNRGTGLSRFRRTLTRRGPNAYLERAIASLSKAQACLTEVSYLKPTLLRLEGPDGTEADAAGRTVGHPST